MQIKYNPYDAIKQFFIISSHMFFCTILVPDGHPLMLSYPLFAPGIGFGGCGWWPAQPGNMA